MKLLEIQAAVGATILALSLPAYAKHSHNLEVFGKRHGHHEHKRLHASPNAEGIESGLAKRGGQCAFPSGAGLVSVTPGAKNAGWAMSPDEECKPGSYCPYACPPGQVMAQWDPKATSYTYPASMNGGLFCDKSGSISKPFPSKPYCVDGSGAVGVQNKAGGGVAFCQTVLPGNEAMLIPTHISSWEQLAVPNPSYWCSTAAHYYINPPGVSTKDGCIWGDGTKPIGNWSPYVAGANTDTNGNTFLKIGWNPIWTSCDLSKTPPTFGIKIACSGSGCNGTPCSIDPSVNGVGGVTSSDQASGAGGANFCVVTVPKGQTANVVVFEVGNSEGGSGSSGSSSKSSSSSSKASPSPTPTPSSTSSATPTSTSSSTPPPSTTSTSTSSSSSSSSSSTSSSTSTSSSSSSSSSSSTSTTSSSSSSSSSSFSSTLLSTSTNTTTSTYPTATNKPHILFENQTSSQSVGLATVTGTSAETTNGTVVSAATATPSKSSGQTMLVSGTTIAVSAMFALASAYLL
ncbi:hypothetical protein BJ875DRAFT_281356 [Amylocarpus encephaloides]|uniref:Uncharacterized protein n=1 Tax=Amylocarpus encephaloides TaxID=45428 RepID=A0A9P7YJR6_9HELO|nr:hypothetical protein BJ875DRAFT_281356 [Amylocarpus encephaloides]